MSPERWEEVKEQVTTRYPVTLNERRPLPQDRPGTVEVIEFNGPLGRLRLEWTDEPLRLNTRALGSKRIGSSTTVVHEYSATERSHRFSVQRWDEQRQSWVELRLAGDSFTA